MPTIKSLQDLETNSRKNVKLSSANQLAQMGEVDQNGNILGTYTGNHNTQNVDSPKIYANDNIISQPKLNTSANSNKSDGNTTKAQEPDMQLVCLENSDYGPDSEFAKSNMQQKSHKSLALISKRKTEIRILNNHRDRKAAGMRIPIT